MDWEERKARDEYIHARAYELAISGVHISPITVILEIVNEGYPEAADLLNTEIIRNDLRRVCTNNWEGAKTIPPISIEWRQGSVKGQEN